MNFLTKLISAGIDPHMDIRFSKKIRIAAGSGNLIRTRNSFSYFKIIWLWQPGEFGKLFGGGRRSYSTRDAVTIPKYDVCEQKMHVFDPFPCTEVPLSIDHSISREILVKNLFLDF